VGELEGVEPVDVDAGQGDELVLVAERRQFFLERSDGLVVEVLLPVERRRAVVGEQLARGGGLHGLGELAGEAEVRRAGLAPHQIGVRGVGDAAADGLFETILDAVEAFGGALAGKEGLVVRVVIGGDQVGGFGVGAGQDDGRHAHDVGGETRGDQLLDGFGSRHQHLAAHVAALLDGCELVFEVHAGGARDDHVLHQFEGVEHTPEAGFGIRHDGQEVVDEFLVARFDAARPLDLVGTLERVVDAANHGRYRVVGVQRLVGVHGFRGVAVGGNLPAGEIDGFQAGLGLLHGLASGDGAEGIHIALGRFAVHQAPQFFGAALGKGVFDLQRATQPDDVFGAIATLDALPAGILGPVFFQGSNLSLAVGHCFRPLSGDRGVMGCSIGKMMQSNKYLI